jgi:hypothetical protein
MVAAKLITPLPAYGQIFRREVTRASPPLSSFSPWFFENLLSSCTPITLFYCLHFIVELVKIIILIQSLNILWFYVFNVVPVNNTVNTESFVFGVNQKSSCNESAINNSNISPSISKELVVRTLFKDGSSPLETQGELHQTLKPTPKKLNWSLGVKCLLGTVAIAIIAGLFVKALQPSLTPNDPGLNSKTLNDTEALNATKALNDTKALNATELNPDVTEPQELRSDGVGNRYAAKSEPPTPLRPSDTASPDFLPKVSKAPEMPTDGPGSRPGLLDPFFRMTSYLFSSNLEKEVKALSVNSFMQGSKTVAMPNITIQGMGTLSFPMQETEIKKLIENSEAASFALNKNVVYDPEIRKTRSVPLERVNISGDAWQKDFNGILEQVKNSLGYPHSISADLYKFLIYEKGDFFKSHMDSQKSPDMFGTMVIVLPSAHEGGQLILKHDNKETTIDLSGGQDSELKFTAFSLDCAHEVLPIKQGYRVGLVYSLNTVT